MNSTPILIQPDIVTWSPAVNLALCASVVQSPTIDRGKTRPAATSPAALPRRLFCTEYRQQAKQSSRLEPLNGAAAGVALKGRIKDDVSSARRSNDHSRHRLRTR